MQPMMGSALRPHKASTKHTLNEWHKAILSENADGN